MYLKVDGLLLSNNIIPILCLSLLPKELSAVMFMLRSCGLISNTCRRTGTPFLLGPSCVGESAELIEANVV